MDRAHVVGSLMRPRFLQDARGRLAAGEITPAAFKRIEDRAVDWAIALQEGAGLALVNDGELRRGHFSAPLSEAIEGVARVEGNVHKWHTAGGVHEQEIPVAVTERIRRRRSVVTEEFVYARARARARVKVTVPSPTMILYFWSTQHTASAYSDPFDLVADAADIVRAEILDLVALGCEHVQIDAPELTFHVDPVTRRWQEEAGIETGRLLTEGIEIINSVIDVPGVEFSIHLCRGNGSTERWLAQGGYDEIAEAVFQRAAGFDTYLLEYDDPKVAGTFEALARAPKDKQIVLGLISSKTGALEDPAEVRARIDEAARYFPRERLGISTQCGFASGGTWAPMSEDEQEAKLRLVTELASTAW
jgi:5-methyltetrahydropteroyltriglutamate--homocysteine methyltransferase